MASSDAAKRVKKCDDSGVVFMGKEFKGNQCLFSRPGIITLREMIKLLGKCPPVALQVYREQDEGTADRADIWSVTGPLAWLMILSITDKTPQTDASEVLALFQVFVADGFRLILRGALADVFGRGCRDGFTPTELLARIENGALESDLCALGIYKVPENMQTVNLSLGPLTTLPSDELIAECTDAASNELVPCGLILCLRTSNSVKTLLLRDKRAYAFLRRITGKDQCHSLTQMVLCDGVVPSKLNGVDTAMLAVAFGATEGPTATFHVYDSTESVEMKVQPAAES